MKKTSLLLVFGILFCVLSFGQSSINGSDYNAMVKKLQQSSFESVRGRMRLDCPEDVFYAIFTAKSGNDTITVEVFDAVSQTVNFILKVTPGQVRVDLSAIAPDHISEIDRCWNIARKKILS